MTQSNRRRRASFMRRPQEISSGTMRRRSSVAIKARLAGFSICRIRCSEIQRGDSADGPARTSDVLGQLLRAVRPGAHPVSAEELGAWWRSATAGQVRALLPGGGHLVVVTSRDPLADLASDGAVLHRLGPLDPAAARQYFTVCLGAHRISREPQAADHIAQMSAGMPLAMALAVQELAAHPARSLLDMSAALSTHLAPIRTGRSALIHQEAAITAALDHAYWALRRDTAAVCDLARPAAHDALAALHDAHLIEAVSDLDDPLRGRVYRYHDAARAHARQRAEAEATAGEETETRRRGLDFFLAAATAAERLLTPTHLRLARDYSYPPGVPMAFTDQAAALAWLESQRHNLLAAIRTADAAGIDTVVWQLAHAIWPLLRSTHDYELWNESHQLGFAAAVRCGNRAAVREMLGTWAVGLRGAARHDDAERAFTQVLEMAREDNDERSEAQALHEIGSVYLATERLVEAQGFLLRARERRVVLGAAAHDEREQLAYRRGVALTDICLGQVLIGLGRPEEAVSALTSARDVLLAIEDRFDAGRALAWRGRAHAENGDLARGEAQGRQAVDEFATISTPRWNAHSLELLGQTLLSGGHLERARTLFRRAIDIYAPISRRDEQRVRRLLEASR
ncbi:tetratricopeptide repeat protein (plasmid) [Streptomyces sp. AM 4-1-1]|uniref:tetratricopeptide repeat protein n=1 Tax=Streptomyces sp. AM 4-1-1 TaxID=3028710 RepID=UPI0023B93A6B|nr:tetratricopeptide repeat protein [Streptomyces sp. AM 4-1-1]WEH37850.1 tetratricopeptide repeat protein [Streptomyces sp. AM 4-1-1]